jgi:hypothetical protein
LEARQSRGQALRAEIVEMATGNPKPPGCCRATVPPANVIKAMMMEQDPVSGP